MRMKGITMAKQKQSKFSAASENRRVARDRVGIPKPTRIEPDGRQKIGKHPELCELCYNVLDECVCTVDNEFMATFTDNFFEGTDD